MRYLILASPRSGSTLVGRMLRATGKAGDPREYFNRHLLEGERARRGIADLSFLDFVELAEKDGKARGGPFGVHLHLSQFEDAYESSVLESPAMVEFLRSFDKFIWVRRQQRLYQAASWSIARQTRAFTSDQQAPIVDPSTITPHHLVRSLAFVSHNDSGWEAILHHYQLQHQTVWYEDLVENYDAVCRGVLEHLGLSEEVPAIPPPPIAKQATEANDRLVSRLLFYLGVKEARL